MQLTPLTALSSVDGRYAGRTEALRPICSEFGLLQRRLLVEVRWFEALAAHEGVAELPRLGAGARAFLDALLAGFDEAAAARIKEIEAVTNPQRTLFAIKRLIGRRWDDAEVQRDLKMMSREGFMKCSRGDRVSVDAA